MRRMVNEDGTYQNPRRKADALRSACGKSSNKLGLYLTLKSEVYKTWFESHFEVFI